MSVECVSSFLQERVGILFKAFKGKPFIVIFLLLFLSFVPSAPLFSACSQIMMSLVCVMFFLDEGFMCSLSAYVGGKRKQG